MKPRDTISQSSPKNVCMFVFNNFTHDSRVLKEASSLARIGYAVTVVARLDDNTIPLENINGVRVKRIPVNPFHLRLIHLIKKMTCWEISPNRNNTTGHPQYFKRIALGFSEITAQKPGNSLTWFQKGIRTIVSYVRRLVNRGIRGIRRPFELFLMRFHRPLVILDFNYRILKTAKVEKYTVFHAHDLNTLIGAYWAAKKQGARLIYDSHELYLERNRFQPYNPIGKWMRRKVEGYLMKRSDRVITVNDSLARMLADKYEVELPTVVMNAPSCQKATTPSHSVSLRHAIGVQDDYAILLYAGSITFNRGLENLIESLVYLPQCFLVLMGYSSDHYEDKLKAIAAEKGVASRLAFFGPVPTDEVTLYASSADLGVAPIENVCLSYYYCSPNKLFEYLLAGLPVIASDFPEMRQIIDEYGVGTTFDPSAPKDIARAAMEILAAPQKRRNIKEKTEAVASIYNWENESRKLIHIYQSLS